MTILFSCLSNINWFYQGMYCWPGLGKTAILILENGCTQPLLLSKDGKQECADEECDDDDNDDGGQSKRSRKPVNSIMLAYKLLTPSVKVLLYIHTLLALMNFSCILFHQFSLLALKCCCVKWCALVTVVAISLFFLYFVFRKFYFQLKLSLIIIFGKKNEH